MKKLLLCIAMSGALAASAQTTNEKPGKETFVVQEPGKTEPVESYLLTEPAEFPGGRAALMKYLSSNIVYPQSALEDNKQGKCYLRFIVTKTGKIMDVQLQKGVAKCPECDAEAMRVVSAMPDWIPGKLDGKAVDSYFNLPIGFTLTP